MIITNKFDLPAAIVRAVSNDEYSRGTANISATGLIDPPRKQALYEVHRDELVEDASDRIYSLIGRAIHRILEEGGWDITGLIDMMRRLISGEDVRAPVEALLAQIDSTRVIEQRFFMTVPGPLGDWVVSGAMDNIDLVALPDGSVRIEDWKTAKTDEMVFGVKVEREQQLNIYRVLLEANGYKVGALRDYFLLRDWSKVRAARTSSAPSLSAASAASDYPQSQVVVHDIEMWPYEKAVQFVLERVSAHQGAQGTYTDADQSSLPECSDEERWSKPPLFAVVKLGESRAARLYPTREEAEVDAAGRTTPFGAYEVTEKNGRLAVFAAGAARASKTFDTQAEADEWVASKVETYDVVERPAESIRCRFFCSVSEVCDQWANIQAGGTSDA